MIKTLVDEKEDVARAHGFTLVELLITVAVVAILAAVAFPSYTESVRKTRRSDATTELAETAQTLERCYTRYNVYNNNNCPIQSGTAFTSSEGIYTVTPTVTAIDYSLTATPVGTGVQAGDTGCTKFTLTSTGVKTAEGTIANKCWGG